MTQTDGLNEQIKKTIDETMAAFHALGIPNEVAAGLLVVQGAIRMQDQEEIRKLRDFLDGLANDYDKADEEDEENGIS
ncbi:hypothetical protein [Tardiphaga sp. 285_C5_N1_2]|uniref:hypothetical protein n=1 Tax=Tardiphaga sp. 285_C5_N1_2 TaxID=3240775 RepID=UPI003F890709